MTKINFVDYLTKKDIKDILALLGLKLIEEVDGEKCARPIFRIKTKDENCIIVTCSPIKNEQNELLNGFINTEGKIHKKLIPYMSFLGATSNFYSKYINNTFLKLEDFFAYETISIKSDDEQLETLKKFTKIYRDYMHKKFGNFYLSELKKEEKRLRKELATQTETTQEQQV